MLNLLKQSKRSFVATALIAIGLLLVGLVAYFAIRASADTNPKLYTIRNDAGYQSRNMAVILKKSLGYVTINSVATPSSAGTKISNIVDDDAKKLWTDSQGTLLSSLNGTELTKIVTALNGINTNLTIQTTTALQGGDIPIVMQIAPPSGIPVGAKINSVEATIAQNSVANSRVGVSNNLANTHMKTNSGNFKCAGQFCTVSFSTSFANTPWTLEDMNNLFIGIAPGAPGEGFTSPYSIGNIKITISYTLSDLSSARVKPVLENATDSLATGTVWTSAIIQGPVTIPSGAAAKIRWYGSDDKKILDTMATKDFDAPSIGVACDTGVTCSSAVALANAPSTTIPLSGIKGRYATFVLALYSPSAAKPEVFQQIQVNFTPGTIVPLPTVDLKVEANGIAKTDGPITIQTGTPATLSWTSTDSTACSVSGGWTGQRGTSGREPTGNLATAKTYSIVCSGAGGTSQADSVTINVSATNPTPTVDIKVSGSDVPQTIDYGVAVQLSWKSENATTCTASGSWSGDKAVPEGAQSTGALTTVGDNVYTLTCANSAGSKSDSATIKVNPAALPSVNLKANNSDGPIEIGKGLAVNLSWTTSSATSCIASTSPTSTWAGDKPVNGAEVSPIINADTIIFLSCTGSGGTKNDSVIVKITNIACDPTSPISITSILPNYFNKIDEGTIIKITGQNLGSSGTIKMKRDIRRNQSEIIDVTDIASWTPTQIVFRSPKPTDTSGAAAESLNGIKSQMPDIEEKLKERIGALGFSDWFGTDFKIEYSLKQKPYYFEVKPDGCELSAKSESKKYVLKFTAKVMKYISKVVFGQKIGTWVTIKTQDVDLQVTSN